MCMLSKRDCNIVKYKYIKQAGQKGGEKMFIKDLLSGIISAPDATCTCTCSCGCAPVGEQSGQNSAASSVAAAASQNSSSC